MFCNRIDFIKLFFESLLLSKDLLPDFLCGPGQFIINLDCHLFSPFHFLGTTCNVFPKEFNTFKTVDFLVPFVGAIPLDKFCHFHIHNTVIITCQSGCRYHTYHHAQSKQYTQYSIFHKQPSVLLPSGSFINFCPRFHLSILQLCWIKVPKSREELHCFRFQNCPHIFYPKQKKIPVTHTPVFWKSFLYYPYFIIFLHERHPYPGTRHWHLILLRYGEAGCISPHARIWKEHLS